MKMNWHSMSKIDFTEKMVSLGVSSSVSVMFSTEMAALCVKTRR
jgi:hypothetical protein